MITSLEPKFEYTDGVGFVVSTQEDVKDGDTVFVYIPFVMSEIEKSTEIVRTNESIKSAAEVCINSGTIPNTATIVTTVNYMPVKAVGKGVVTLTAGEKVTVESDTDTIKDLMISI